MGKALKAKHFMILKLIYASLIFLSNWIIHQSTYKENLNKISLVYVWYLEGCHLYVYLILVYNPKNTKFPFNMFFGIVHLW